MGIKEGKSLQITWASAAKLVSRIITEYVGHTVSCEAKADDPEYWSVKLCEYSMPMSEFYLVCEQVNATAEEIRKTLPDDDWKFIRGFDMDLVNHILSIALSSKWENLYCAEEFLCLIGVTALRTADTDTRIVIGDLSLDMRALKSCQELLNYLNDNGPTHTALMDFCEEYRNRYQNELCWAYPISDGRHLGTFLVLVREGILSLPYDDADKVDYELFCLDDVAMFDTEAMELFIHDWDAFDKDLRQAMSGMKDYLQKCESTWAGDNRMSFFRTRSQDEWDEILSLAKFIGDYNMQKGSIDERYLPYVREVAEALYDEGYRKVSQKKEDDYESEN